MPDSNIKTLYTFTVLTDRLVDEVTEKTEVVDGVERGLTETIKVNKPTPTYFAFKKPSRAEREAAEEERAVWWFRYLEKGFAPEAQLLKVYANLGGILSDDQKREYTADRRTYLQKQEDLIIAKAIKETPPAEIERLMDDMIDLRDKIMRFEQEQSTFFENTAEARAGIKLAEYLVYHLSYTRTSEDQPWVPYFAGSTTELKAAEHDRLEEAGDKVFNEAKPQLLFLARFTVDSGFAATKDDIDEFLKSRV